MKDEMKTVDVKSDFGAVGDGIIDDTDAVQQAINSVREYGGTIHFPKGIYLISSCIIFYSDQTLLFDNGAVLKRKKLSRDKEPAELRYMMASFTSPETQYGEYNGVHGTVIKGAVFDANEEIFEDSKVTILNTCHTADIEICGCKFIHGSVWHCIELNSSKNITVRNCIFDGNSYTVIRDGWNELVQIDAAKDGLYGPVFFKNGEEMKFVGDETVCRNITVCGCKFICNDFAAIGGHTDFKHSDITLYNNEFLGEPGERGYFAFTKSTENIKEYDNIFEKTDCKNITV